MDHGMTHLIEFNKLSHLHNGSNIIFCKTDFINVDLVNIRNLNREVVLLTGNSDLPIDSRHIQNLPKNIIAWYAQNLLVSHEKLHPIPLGLENQYFANRQNHGVGYERGKIKEQILLNHQQITPSKKVYANFKVETNPNYRKLIREICIKSNFIEWEEPNLNIENFFNKVLQYESCVCPVGNGVDTHRLWEILYLNRIPITIRVGNFKIYELYEKLPIVILDHPNDLLDNNLIIKKIEEKKKMIFDRELLTINYWVEKVKSHI